MILVGPSDAELLSWIESGVLLPITEYCYDETLAPNLHEAMERTGVNILQQITMYDGEIYGIPRLNQSYTNEYPDKAYYNMEWLEQLGMSAPTTADELYELLVKVKETDLNGNGVHDEIGMVGTFGNGYEGWASIIACRPSYTQAAAIISRWKMAWLAWLTPPRDGRKALSSSVSCLKKA